MSNIDALADSVSTTIKGYIGERFKAFESSIAETFRKMVDALPRPQDGKSVDPVEIERQIAAVVAQAVAAIPKAKDGDPGKNADEAAIVARVLADVTKAFDSIPIPENGKDADPQVVAAMVAAEVARLPRPENGKDADPLLVQALVRSEVVEAVSKIRVPEDGKSVDPLAVRGMVEAEVAAAVGKIPAPANGKDFDPVLLRAEVERAVAAIPKPQNGKDGIDGVSIKGDPGTDGKDADPEVIRRMVIDQMALVPNPRDGIDGKDYDPVVLRAECMLAARAAIAELPPAPAGKDANPVEIADAVFDRLMKSIRMPEDGKSVTVEDVKPLLEGEVSRWELDFERRATDVLQRAIDRMPRPKDGLGFDDLTVEEKDDRTIAFVFRQGDREKRFEYTLPVMIDRGTFKAGQSYEKGDGVTYGGSLFFAQRATLPTERPEDGSGAFRLAVKRGRDGS